MKKQALVGSGWKWYKLFTYLSLSTGLPSGKSQLKITVYSTGGACRSFFCATPIQDNISAQDEKAKYKCTDLARCQHALEGDTHGGRVQYRTCAKSVSGAVRESNHRCCFQHMSENNHLLHSFPRMDAQICRRIHISTKIPVYETTHMAIRVYMRVKRCLVLLVHHKHHLRRLHGVAIGERKAQGEYLSLVS